MRTLPLGSIHTGSNALVYGLLTALAAVALVVAIAGFDMMRPADHLLSPKLHSQA